MIDYEVIRNENRISAIFEILRCEMGFTYTQVANELLEEEDKLEMLARLDNAAISNDMLFKLYYMANETIGNRFLDEYVICCAQRLKDLSLHEIGSR